MSVHLDNFPVSSDHLTAASSPVDENTSLLDRISSCCESFFSTIAEWISDWLDGWKEALNEEIEINFEATVQDVTATLESVQERLRSTHS